MKNVKCLLRVLVIIGPKSDHWKPLSVTSDDHFLLRLGLWIIEEQGYENLFIRPNRNANYG